MDDFNLSSCSFLTETEENTQDQPILQADMQNLVLQNERLQEVNNQLKSSLENVRSQLREALEAASSVNSLTDQIKLLKSQLIESNEKREKLSQELKIAAENGESSNSKLLQEISELTSERDSLADDLRKITDQKNKLKGERQNLRSALEEKQMALENLIEDLSKLKQQKTKLQQKQAASVSAMKDMENQIEQLKVKSEKDNNENTTLAQEVGDLKLKVTNLTQENNELKNEIESYKAENATCGEAVKGLENQLDSQREEIENMALEKQKIILLLQKMSAALSASEIRIESLQKENRILTAKQTQKQQQRQTSPITKTEILDLKIPFEGEIGDDCEKIIKLPQYQPIQRVQLIFNEAAKRIVEVETELRELKNSNETMSKEFSETKANAQQYVQILTALLKDLKEITINEDKIIKVSTCSTDKQFINYMSDKCAQIEPILREKVLSDPHFISDDFFFTDDLTKRKKEIQSICDQSDTTFAILTAQFIANTLLRKQVNSLLGIKESSTAQSPVEEREIPVEEQQQQQQCELSYQELQEKLQKATKIAKQLKAQLKRSQQVQMELQKADSEQKTKIAQLQIQNDDLKNEIDVANMKLQVKPSDAKSQNSVSGLVSQLKESFEEQKKSPEQDSMAIELRRKTEECNQLNALLNKAHESFDSAIQTKTKQYKKQEEAMRREIISLSEQNEALTQQISMKKKQQKKKEKIYAQHQEQTINELTRNYEETKASLNATIETLKDKAQQARDMSQKLMNQIAEYEQKNQQLTAENAQFNANQKKIQVELASMKQQINKERQHLQGQLSAQMMAYEAKIQKIEKEANEKADKRVNDLLDVAQDTLGAAYELDGSDFDEDIFKQLVAMVKSDLEKLHYFQSETTKFTLDKKNA